MLTADCWCQWSGPRVGHSAYYMLNCFERRIFTYCSGHTVCSVWCQTKINNTNNQFLFSKFFFSLTLLIIHLHHERVMNTIQIWTTQSFEDCMICQKKIASMTMHTVNNCRRNIITMLSKHSVICKCLEYTYVQWLKKIYICYGYLVWDNVFGVNSLIFSIIRQIFF